MSAETFDAAWLALREPVDHQSRSQALVERLAHWWIAGPRAAVLDLGSGTGSNLRYLAPRLGGEQSWTLLDHDAGLLSRVAGVPAGVTIDARVGDLATEGLSLPAGAELVTASALLDLVSVAWVEALVEKCRARRAAAHFALSYDGTIEWADADRDDPFVRTAVNQHQRGDKGLGPALGPDAASFTENAFRRAGYQTHSARSPWRLGADDRELVRALLAGWAEAAEEQRPEERDRVRAWATRRRATVDSGRFELTVGHVDLLAIPPRDRAAG